MPRNIPPHRQLARLVPHMIRTPVPNLHGILQIVLQLTKATLQPPGTTLTAVQPTLHRSTSRNTDRLALLLTTVPRNHTLSRRAILEHIHTPHTRNQSSRELRQAQPTSQLHTTTRLQTFARQVPIWPVSNNSNQLLLGPASPPLPRLRLVITT